jgi:hypothetical protein
LSKKNIISQTRFVRLKILKVNNKAKKELMNSPISDKIPFFATVPQKNPVGLYVVCGVLIVLLITVTIYSFTKKTTRKAKVVQTQNTGYLRVNDGQYINVKSRIFPNHEFNYSVSLTLGEKPETIWIQEFVSGSSSKFVLKTEIQGLIFALQQGPPGAGAPWGIAYLAPVVKAVNNNVFLTEHKKTMSALSSTWQDENLTFLRFCPKSQEIFWSKPDMPYLSEIQLVP